MHYFNINSYRSLLLLNNQVQPVLKINLKKEDGKVLYEKGLDHDSNGKPMTAKSKNSIASDAKPFTAFAILQLVDEEEIKLDEPVVNYLPKLTLEDVRLKRVTVRQMLSHTFGSPTLLS
ncbi:serine hydrolase [Desemzia sp. RIT804]|uniref:serine hydrolase domain-containing protein n=1 Tax=Desemzia sp. RIT 804 TaxID=2810209 RepID=UPI0019512D34|nr:serine hydrolase [Desemzia sp. RIT 804]MBM6614630.1 serine hydrolase [Desemzia sp. RIT 804]